MMCLAYKIVEKVTRKHPFGDEKASRAWLDRLRRRHTRLTICLPQPLSYAQALCANEDTINVFLKVKAIFG